MTGRPISFAFVDGRPLFLDLEEDLYFLLEPAAEAQFARWLDSGASRSSVPGPLGDALHPDRLDSNPVTIARPLESALDGSGPRCTLSDVLSVWRLVREARSAVRRGRLARIISEIEGGRGDASPESSPETAASLAARFATALGLAPAGGNCLSRSLALLRWLAERGAGATLVFGAKLDPFAAHCWLQSGAILLNDHPDRVERFTPVRLIECTPVSR